MTLQQPVPVLLIERTIERTDQQRNQQLINYLNTTSHVEVEYCQAASLPDDIDAFKALIIHDPTWLSESDHERLVEYVRKGGGVLGLVCASANRLPDVFGAQIREQGPYIELRIMLAEERHPISARLPAVFFVENDYLPLQPTNGDVQALFNTVWHFETVPLALLRDQGAGRVGCTTLNAYDSRIWRQYMYRMLRHVAGLGDPATLGVGILGYSRHIGQMHGLSIQQVPGLEMRAAADLVPELLEQAQRDFPGVSTYRSSEELGNDPDVDIVFVVTPPNIHSRLTIEMLEAGKHVVVEKPMGISWAETQAMIETANNNDRVLSVHQNRRWDVDFIAIRKAIKDGLIGEPFYLETFVGSYAHPCEHWHSHMPVSGGAMYDWGAHYIDWILNLMPEPTASVIGSLHKRVWHDVTNADQARVQIRFAGGQEAEFIHSDLSALRKPKWYLLGTEGAIVAEWNDVTVYEIDPIVFYREEEIPATEMPPRLTLRRKDGLSENMVTQELPLPERSRNPYHTNLADHLLTGDPLAVTAESSARVVAVMEAATRSAQQGGTVEELHV